LVGRSPDPSGNAFFADLQIPKSNYVASGWCAFMQEVSVIVAANQLARIRTVCRELCQERGWDQANESFEAVLSAFAILDLLSLGRLRARWQMSRTKYVSEEELGELGERALADLIMGAGHLQRLLGGELRVGDDCTVEVWDGQRCMERVTLAHGGGTRSLDLIEEELIAESDLLLHGRRPSRHVLVGGADPGSSTNPLPGELTGESEDADLILGPDAWSFVNIADLRDATSIATLPWWAAN